MRMPPACNAAINDIKRKRHRRQGGGCKKKRGRLGGDIRHRQEHTSHATACVGERKQIRQMHAADHAEMFARLGTLVCHLSSLAQARQRERRLSWLVSAQTHCIHARVHPHSAAGTSTSNSRARNPTLPMRLASSAPDAACAHTPHKAAVLGVAPRAAKPATIPASASPEPEVPRPTDPPAKRNNSPPGSAIQLGAPFSTTVAPNFAAARCAITAACFST